MAALVTGIHVAPIVPKPQRELRRLGVDGRYKPGHDGGVRTPEPPRRRFEPKCLLRRKFPDHVSRLRIANFPESTFKPPTELRGGITVKLANAPPPCYFALMVDVEPKAIFEAVSRGEISRMEAERRLGTELGFGDMLLKLREYGLPLPRFPSDPNSPGVRLIRDLASRGTRAG